MAADKSFTIDLKVGESLEISGGSCIVTLVSKSGQLARLAFIAGEAVRVVKGKKASPGAAQARHGLRISTAT